MDDLIIVGDEAWTPQEWTARERQRDLKRAYRQRNRERIRDYERVWRARNREKVNAYNREWMRRHRGTPTRRPPVEVTYAIGSLHDGACTGPTRATGCRCQKIRVSTLVPREKAA